jgi:CMP-N-acetylneuraminic acid synthetase
MLGGKPLLLHTVEAALAAARVGSTLVSTDDNDIARVAKAAGAEVPALRPAELARDESAMMGVIQHAVALAEAGGRWVEAVVLLQPTSPFRTAAQIDAAIACYEASGADTLTAVRAAGEHPYYAWRQEGDRLAPFFSMHQQQMVRQELPAAFVETGAIFILRRSDLDSGEFYGSKIVPFEMNELTSIDIDTPQDLAFAEFLLAKGRTGGGA